MKDSQNKDFVSIIMPVYNASRFVREAVDSVLSQSFTDFEFIIIDDASTDGTYEILKEYQKRDSRIRLYRNSENLKIVKSLNIGLKKVKGDFIARIDGDDIWYKEKLKIQIEYFKGNEDLYLLGTAKKLIDETGKVINKKEQEIFSFEDIKKNILRGNLFCHSSVLFKSELINTVGYYNESFKNTEDYEYWIRIISKFRSEILPVPLTYYRITPEMVSLRKRKQQNYYILKAKYRGFKLMGFSYRYIPNLIGDIYRMLVPDFLIKLKRYLRRVSFVNKF